MRKLNSLGKSVLCLACLGLVLPMQAMAAAPQKIADVALTAGGTLKGRFVDTQGRAVDGATIKLSQAQQEVASTVTDEQGQYSVSGLKGGLYQLTIGNSSQNVRLWAENTAPPQAQQFATIVKQDQVVRGGAGTGGADLLVLGGIAGTLAVAIVNASEINDLEDKLDDQDAAFEESVEELEDRLEEILDAVSP